MQSAWFISKWGKTKRVFIPKFISFPLFYCQEEQIWAYYSIFKWRHHMKASQNIGAKCLCAESSSCVRGRMLRRTEDWAQRLQFGLLSWCSALNPYPSSQFHEPGHFLCLSSCCIAHTPVTAATSSCNLHRLASRNKAFNETITDPQRTLDNWFSKTVTQTPTFHFTQGFFQKRFVHSEPFLLQCRVSFDRPLFNSKDNPKLEHVFPFKQCLIICKTKTHRTQMYLKLYG